MQQGPLPKIVYPLNGFAVSSISKAAAAVVTVPIAPSSGTSVTIIGATGTGWSAVNTTTTATNLTPTTFSIPINSTGFGTLGGTVTVTYTLPFTRQPRLVPAYNYEAIRHDNLASSGVRETVFERNDTFLEFKMEWLAVGTDADNWNVFSQAALMGVPFYYYPNSAVNSSILYLLEDTTAKPRYKATGVYEFDTKFRLRVAWP